MPDTKSPMQSKINWTQAVAALSAILVVGFGSQATLTPSEQAAIVTVITLIQGAATFVMRTWFTTKMTPQSKAGAK